MTSLVQDVIEMILIGLPDIKQVKAGAKK